MPCFARRSCSRWLTRDTDSNASVNYTLTHNERGDMTDDGEAFEYVYDAFGRLVEGRNTSNQAVVTKYRYNGLGYRIMMQYDVDADTSLEDDERRYFCYDAPVGGSGGWRVIATFKDHGMYTKGRFEHRTVIRVGPNRAWSVREKVRQRERSENQV